jgi:alanyl-tRNA synthetase
VSTLRLYRDDPYLLEFQARVIDRLEHEGRPAVVLDQTAFYPESGGQPWDTGSLNDVRVVAAYDHHDTVLHVLDGPLADDTVAGCVDGERRRDHREQHHGQHLLSRAFETTAGARTVSFHLGSDTVSIDLDREVSEEQARAAETRTNEAIWSARPVRVRIVTRAEAARLGVRAPEDAGDAIRLVEAEGFDVQPCGGTHPRSTAEVGLVLLLDQERYKGGSRVRFVCGHRATDAFHERAAVLSQLCAVLSSPLGGLPDSAQRVLETRDAALKRVAELILLSLDAEATRLLASAADDVIVARYEGWDPEALRGLAQRLTAQRTCVALLGSSAEKAHLAFAQTDGLGHDIPALLKTAAARLGGRGGGRGNLAQGGGDRREALGAALEQAAQAVRTSPRQ